jgi:ABC-type phosphate transport system substrate-binding protein
MGKPLTTLRTLLFLMMFWSACAPCSAGEVILVVNHANSLSAITGRAAELIFLGKKTEWTQEGGHIHVVVNNDPPTYALFCREILKKAPLQYLLYRKKLLFSGTGLPPLTVANDEEVKAFVAAHRDAIGFIRQEALDSRVKQLFIH